MKRVVIIILRNEISNRDWSNTRQVTSEWYVLTECNCN